MNEHKKLVITHNNIKVKKQVVRKIWNNSEKMNIKIYTIYIGYAAM